MNAVVAEPQRWPLRRWLSALVIVGAGQLIFIFWLGDYSAPKPRGAALAPVIEVSGQSSWELLALNDPTLFALPHRQGFAGAAWMAASRPPEPPADRPEEPFWLPLSTRGLGQDVSHFLGQRATNPPLPLLEPRPAFVRPPLPPGPAVQSRSSVRFEGALAARALLNNTAELPAWPNEELLTNTVVALAITAGGDPFSATLLSSSGSKEADQRALREAHAIRFQAAEDLAPGQPGNIVSNLAWGKMIFEWRTVPAQTTNVPPAAANR
jgi:hypothetical protein